MMMKDWFRYEVLYRFGGWWVDADIAGEVARKSCGTEGSGGRGGEMPASTRRASDPLNSDIYL